MSTGDNNLWKCLGFLLGVVSESRGGKPGKKIMKKGFTYFRAEFELYVVTFIFSDQICMIC